MTSALLSALHTLALGIGLGAVFARGRALKGEIDLDRLFRADNWWGVAALLWLSTGLLRAFGGFEKGTSWYLSNPLFHLKLTMFALIFLLELWPMVTFIRWRIARRKGQSLNLALAPGLRAVNQIELVLVVLIPFVAALMARGIGM